ncbi:MAG: hypothetical protein JJ896_04855 [Rhodothermales bacterium]|nr:hypothetical protein [Rhodothermales bacterium]MBO6778963.1 hypothetical protein [Rhodothermales bacterium]
MTLTGREGARCSGLCGSFWFAVCSLLLAPPVQARQVTYDAGFERAVNRYRWQGALTANHSFGDWSVGAVNRYRSDAFLLFNDRLSFRDVNSLRVQASRPVGARSAAVARVRSDWFSLSRVLTQSVYGGVSLGLPALTITPLVGVAMDRRPGVRGSAQEGAPLRSDAGPGVGLELFVPRQEQGGYTVELQGFGLHERLSPRASTAARMLASAERSFERTTLRMEAQGGMARRDAYQAASFLNRDDSERVSESVESTRSDTLGAGLSLRAPVGRAWRLNGGVRFDANNRRVRTLRSPEGALFFDSDFRRRTVDADAGVTFEQGSTMFRIALQGGAEIERRVLANEGDLPPTQAAQKRDLLRQADYDRGFMTVQTAFRMPLKGRTMLAGDVSANAIRHDTPIINPDDRDEIFFNGRLALLYRPSRTLEADVQLFGSHYHTVYLKSARSAENNVQQGLRLRPAVRWRPRDGTRISLGSEVRATYTIDDFVLPGRRPGDQAARELRQDLEIEHALAPDLRLLAEARFSDLRLGRFLNDTFAEIPFDTLKTYGGWVRLQSGSRVTAEIGLRVFIRTDYDRSSTVRYPRLEEDGSPVVDNAGMPLTTTISRPGRKRIAQIGPTCALTWPLRSGMLRFEGWYTVQRITRDLYGDLPEASAAAIREAARLGERTIIPNLALSMQWTL